MRRLLLTLVAAPLVLAAGGGAAASSCVEDLPLRWKAAQVLMPAVYGPEVEAQGERWARLGLGGALVMTAPDDLAGGPLLRFKQRSTVPVLVATDEEGGTVQRLRSLGRLPGAATMAGSRSPVAARSEVVAHALRVKATGVDVVFAPVVDVSPPGGGGPIERRAFSSNPWQVLAYGKAYVDAWRLAEVLPVVKHFPGHGSATGDTHVVGARTASLDELRRRDLVPFKGLAGSGTGVMVGHLEVPGLTEPDRPASVSPAALRYLRSAAGYRRALVFSDSLGMAAISQRWDLATAVEETIKAGVDMAVFTTSSGVEVVIDRLVQAVEQGRIPAARLDDAVGRVLAAKRVDACALAVS